MSDVNVNTSSENKGNYIAITIGPIGETMNLVTKPASLWGASFIFSYISKHLCELIESKGVAGFEDIITPYFPTEEEEKKEKAEKKEAYVSLTDRKDGVGLFHDHVIVRASLEENVEKMAEIKRQVLVDTAEKLGAENKEECADELEKYIMIAICGFEKQAVEGKDVNAIMYCGRMLDSLELPKHFAPTEKEHPILSRFSYKDGKEEAKDANKKIKDIAKKFGVDMKQWQLTYEDKGKESTVRDIPDIASMSGAPEFKKNGYYCVLRSDGDNVSKIIADLATDGMCREFSKTCLEYCSQVADLVKKYGGSTIFAGGDDLFALVPCQGKNAEGKTVNVLELTKEISGLFEKNFKTHIDGIKAKNDNLKEGEKPTPIPSLSFGIFICHKKFPLYEAIERSGKLLFGIAKYTDAKNCIAVNLQKHSGQSEELLISNKIFDEGGKDFEKIFRLVSVSSDGEKTEAGKAEAEKAEAENSDGKKNVREDIVDRDEFLLSASNKILLFEKLLEASKGRVYHAFKNIFDDIYHNGKKAEFLHEFLPTVYTKYCDTGLITLYENDKKVEPASSAKTLGQFIRFMRFFVEKGGE